jgi:CheY-like chemotaxis protein
MDCEMPVMDGFMTTKLVRSSAFRDIPIIGITATLMDVDKCLPAGMNSRLIKPCTHQQLQKMIECTMLRAKIPLKLSKPSD